MAEKIIDIDIDFKKNKLKNPLLNPLTTTERLALSLDVNDNGYASYDITLKLPFYWDGTTWNAGISSAFYQYIQSVGLDKIQRNKLNFSNNFSITDNSGNNSSDVTISSLDWDVIFNNPSTLQGYGIVDAVSQDDFVFTDDIPVILSGGKTLGKYVNGDTIPSTGKTPLEVISLLATEYLLPTFSSFSVNISSLLEVGTALSGNKTFSWTTTNNSNIPTNSLLIRDVTSNTVLGSGLSNDGSETLDIGAITNTTPITRNWRIEGINTNSGSFQSNNYTVNSIYPVFYGVSNSAPTANQSLINSGTKTVVNSTGTINITFGANGQYLWFAHPASSTTKTKWYVNALDNGNIGTISDLFNTPSTVSVDSPIVLWNGISYKIYISNTPVNTTGNMELRNS